jgi:hypothetical protein
VSRSRIPIKKIPLEEIRLYMSSSFVMDGFVDQSGSLKNRVRYCVLACLPVHAQGFLFVCKVARLNYQPTNSVKFKEV